MTYSLDTHRPNDLLSLQDGAADLATWKKQVGTYFNLTDATKKPVKAQRALFKTLLDEELAKYVDHQIEEDRADININNLLVATQKVFDTLYPRCMRCGETEDYQRNPHHIDNVDCLMDMISDPDTDEEHRELAVDRYRELAAANETERKRCLKEMISDPDTEEEHRAAAIDSYKRLTTTEVVKKDSTDKTGGAFTGRIDIVGPSLTDPTSTILHPKASAVVMFRQGSSVAPARAEADTGSDFTIMFKDFAQQSNIKFQTDANIRQKFKLVDISGTELKVCGHADVEISSIKGEGGFKKTRILIIEEAATNVILGRSDMKALQFIGENFPLPLQPTSVLAESHARALSLIELGEDQTSGPDALDIILSAKKLPTPVPAYKKADNDSDEHNGNENPTTDIKGWREAFRKYNEEINLPRSEDGPETMTKSNTMTMTQAGTAERVTRMSTGLKPWIQALKLLEEEAGPKMVKEMNNGSFLWEQTPGSQLPPLNTHQFDNSRKIAVEDKDKEVEHNKRRGKFLRHGLQQVMYMKRVFDLSLADLYELILREDNRTRGFPLHTRDEIYDAMINNRQSPKKLARQATSNSRTPYNRRAEVIAELSSAIITGLESAESEILQARADQPEIIRARAMATVSREAGVAPADSCTKLCHQKIRKRVRTLELYTGLKQKKGNDVRGGWTCADCTIGMANGRGAPTATNSTNCPYNPANNPHDGELGEGEAEPHNGPGEPEGEGTEDEGGSEETAGTPRNRRNIL